MIHSYTIKEIVLTLFKKEFILSRKVIPMKWMFYAQKSYGKIKSRGS